MLVGESIAELDGTHRTLTGLAAGTGEIYIPHQDPAQPALARTNFQVDNETVEVDNLIVTINKTNHASDPEWLLRLPAFDVISDNVVLDAKFTTGT